VRHSVHLVSCVLYIYFTVCHVHVLRRVSLLDNSDCTIDLMGERCGQQLAVASRNWVQRMKDELGCFDGLFPFCCLFQQQTCAGHRRRKGSVVGGHYGECGARAYLGAEPPGGPGAEPLVRGSGGGEAPLKLIAFWSLDVQRSRQI